MDDHYYVWTPSGTDITQRWRMLGWRPPSETLEYQKKWTSFKELPTRSLSEEDRSAVQLVLRSNVITWPGEHR